MKLKFATGTAIVPLMLSFIYPVEDSQNNTEWGIQFYKGTWNEALTLARKEKKLIFLDIYATWCGPCKWLKRKTFSNKEVGTYYNSAFINVELDGEKCDGVNLANKYNISGYPTLLFINADGKIASGSMGYHNAKTFLELGKNANVKN